MAGKFLVRAGKIESTSPDGLVEMNFKLCW